VQKLTGIAGGESGHRFWIHGETWDSDDGNKKIDKGDCYDEVESKSITYIGKTYTYGYGNIVYLMKLEEVYATFNSDFSHMSRPWNAACQLKKQGCDFYNIAVTTDHVLTGRDE